MFILLKMLLIDFKMTTDTQRTQNYKYCQTYLLIITIVDWNIHIFRLVSPYLKFWDLNLPSYCFVTRSIEIIGRSSRVRYTFPISWNRNMCVRITYFIYNNLLRLFHEKNPYYSTHKCFSWPSTDYEDFSEWLLKA